MTKYRVGFVLAMTVLVWALLVACDAPRRESENTRAVGQAATAATLVSVAVTPDLVNLPLGRTITFDAVGHFSDDTFRTLKKVSWVSGDTTVASISNPGHASGLAVGATTITVFDDLTGLSATATLNVTNAHLTSITIAPVDSSVPVGASTAMVATGRFSDGNVGILSEADVDWSSSKAFVTIDTRGVATGLSVGQTTISVRDRITPSVKDSTTLTVVAAPLLALVVSPPDAAVPAGWSQDFTATGTYAQGTFDVTSAVTWTSTPEATIVPGGVATGIVEGTATITAAYGGFVSAATLTILPARSAVVGLSFRDFSGVLTSLSLYDGEYKNVSVVQTLADGSLVWSGVAGPGQLSSSLAWTTSNAAVTGDRQPYVQALGHGTAVLHVSSGALSAALLVSVQACPAGTVDCDGDPSNGCESPADPISGGCSCFCPAPYRPNPAAITRLCCPPLWFGPGVDPNGCYFVPYPSACGY